MDGPIKYLVERRVDSEEVAVALGENAGDVWTGVGVYEGRTRDAAIEAAVSADGEPVEGTYRATPFRYVGGPVTVTVSTKVVVALGGVPVAAPAAPARRRRKPVEATPPAAD